jgi:uncharacterized membrane protein YkoI
MRILSVIAAAMALCSAVFAEKQLQLQDLPPAVHETVQAELKGAEIKSLTSETEHGRTQYEVETLVNGKHRDFEVDTKGKLLVVEEETAIDTIPAAAKAAILKKVAGGKLDLVELFMRNGETMYEAAYTTKSGRKREVVVKADGTETKD